LMSLRRIFCLRLPLPLCISGSRVVFLCPFFPFFFFFFFFFFSFLALLGCGNSSFSPPSFLPSFPPFFSFFCAPRRPRQRFSFLPSPIAGGGFRELLDVPGLPPFFSPPCLLFFFANSMVVINRDCDFFLFLPLASTETGE